MCFTRALACLNKTARLVYGAVAQLIERVVRNDEVVGLIPIRSTILRRSVAEVPSEGLAKQGV